MLSADRLQIRMGLDVSHKHRNAERDVAIDLLRDIDPIDLEPGLLERVGEAAVRLVRARPG